MTDGIIRKLQAEFQRKIEWESQVVYILVQVRKLLDLENVKDSYVTLRFFCDWALHPKLERRNAGLLLQPFDEAYGRRGTDGMLLAQDQERLEQKVSLIEFSRELRAVMEQHAISGLSGTGPWLQFLELLLSIIGDSPLAYAATREIPLRHINEATVSRYDVPAEVQQLNPEWYMPFGIDWQFSLNGQPVFRWPMPFGILKQ